MTRRRVGASVLSSKFDDITTKYHAVEIKIKTRKKQKVIWLDELFYATREEK